MRVTTRLISAVVAALLAVGAVVALVELTFAALGRTPWIVDWRSLEAFGQEHSWDDAAVRLIGLALVTAGLVLLVAARRPRHPVTLDTQLGTDLTVMTVRRRSLETDVADTARSVDGVADASAHWNGRCMAVHVTTRRAIVAGIDGAVGRRVDALLDSWRIDSEPARVTVRSTDPHPVPLPPPPAPVTQFDDWPPADQATEHEEVLR